MIQRKKPRSLALKMLDNRIIMAKPLYAKEKRRLLKVRGVDVGLLIQKLPKGQVIEQLIEALPKIGVNKWIVDQAANEIYDKVESELMAEGKIAAKPEEKVKARESIGRLLGPAGRERRDMQKFSKMKGRLGPRVAREIENSLYRLGMHEEEFIQLVKRTWAFSTWAKEHSAHEAETMAVEIARDIKREEMRKRNLHERIRAA